MSGGGRRGSGCSRLVYFTSAYILLWVLLMGYVLYLGYRQRQVERELRRMREMIPGEAATGKGEERARILGA